MRLAEICADLLDLYHDPACAGEAPVCRMADDPDIRLLIGHHAVVHIDDARGTYILAVTGKAGTARIETASDELLVDHIICHLALDRGRHLTVAAHGLVSALVGHRLEDVEHSLALATLRQHHFDRARCAEVLGISVQALRDRLRGYRAPADLSGGTAEILRIRPDRRPTNHPHKSSTTQYQPEDIG